MGGGSAVLGGLISMAEAKAGRTNRKEKSGRNIVMMGPLHAGGRSRKVERVKGIEPSSLTCKGI